MPITLRFFLALICLGVSVLIFVVLVDIALKVEHVANVMLVQPLSQRNMFLFFGIGNFVSFLIVLFLWASAERKK